MMLYHMMRARNGAKASGDICSIVMLAHIIRPWSYTFFRLIETVLGIAVAWLLSLAPKLVQLDEIGLASNGADVLGDPRGNAVKRI